MAKLAREHDPGAHEGLGDGVCRRIAERFPDLFGLLESVLQLRARLWGFAGHAPHERDPEVGVREKPPISPITYLVRRALEQLDRAGESGECPARLGAADRGTHPQIHAWVARWKQVEGATEEGHRLALREPLQGVFAGHREMLRGTRGIAGLLEMHRDHGRELPQGAAVLLEERAVGRVLHERVPEEVLEFWLDGSNLDEATPLERDKV